MHGEETAHGGRDQAKHRQANVFVLDRFVREQFYFPLADDEMHRHPAMLVSRIIEHLTGEPLPPPPPPAYASAGPMAESTRDDPKEPNAVAEPLYGLSPIAWSIKIVNLRRAFLPQLREEVIVLVHFSPGHFEDEAFEDGRWVIAHLRRRNSSLPLETPRAADSESRWEVAYTPRLFGSPPESARLSRTANVHLYKEKPTPQEVSQFVYSTDFGNNDIYAHLSESNSMDVDVLLVVLYPEFSKLQNGFQSGLNPEELEHRKAAYEEEFRRKQIMPRSSR